MTLKDFSSYINNADFISLFNECGWDAPKSSRPTSISLSDINYTFSPVAQKRDFTIFTLSTPTIPDSSTRRALDSRLSKLSPYNFIIYISTAEPLHHLWSVPVLRVDRRHLVNVDYNDIQHAQFLLEKLNDINFFSSDPESLTIIDVANRVNSAFLVNTEKITKDFYRDFQKHHTSFVKNIKNVSEPADREWFASVILNRLMFCYFLQKKGFLDQDFNYLSNHLATYQANAPQKNTSFYKSFYRGFLVHLFGDALNSPSSKRPKDFNQDFYGTIPYLNGGMFARHEIEDRNPNLDIPDDVFKSIFNFFDTWEWHLDTSITSSGRDINPDVLGYIFEQYINDRAQMGAYYTKEDITEYIGRNCILPHLLESTCANYKAPFKPKSGTVWQTLAQKPTAYIFPAAKHGLDNFNSLPPDIAQGLNPSAPNLKKRRANWNKPTPEPFALPTEIWRETIARLQRAQALRDKIAAGQISSIQDFITYNLDIRSFTKDLLANTTDPEFLRTFYHALQNITILDPTCGSGAFLFGALNILEPLYETCLDRMQELAANAKQKDPKSKLFQTELDEFSTRGKSNTKYFIYKSIILRNLYGVDIMHEAIEIARLRLFLKMVAAVDVDPSSPNLGLDPLPDIDFNLRCGNTLVGYTSKDAITNGLTNGTMFAYTQLRDKIENGLPIIAETYKAFQTFQLRETDHAKLKETKANLQRRLQEMRDILNDQLYPSAEDKSDKSAKKKAEWIQKVQPFHWYTEFYSIMHDHKGFDVIIGNPPYVSKSKISYLKDDSTFKCPDLYGYVIARVYQLLHANGRHGFIVMHNLAFSDDFKDVRKVIFENSTARHFSFYSRIPAGLFSGNCRVRNTIYLTSKASPTEVTYTSRMHRWYEEQRSCLFDSLSYANCSTKDIIPMVDNLDVLNVMQPTKGEYLAEYLRVDNPYSIYFKKLAYNFLSISDEEAPCHFPNGKKAPQTTVFRIGANSKSSQKLLSLLLSSRLYFLKWCVFGDDLNYTKGELLNFRFPFDKLTAADKNKLFALYDEWSKRSKSTIQYKLNAGKYVGTYNTSKLWDITDKSDLIFLKYLCENPVETQEALILFSSQMAVSFKKGGDDNDEE